MIARFGVFVFDADRRQLTRNGSGIHLTPKAFDLLALLVAEAPRVVRKGEIHNALWPGTFVSEATLVGLVKEIRRALGDHDDTGRIVRTAHGVGYALGAPLERAGGQGAESGGCWLTIGGRRVMLHDGENIIGRGPEASMFLDAGGVSRRHARITAAGRGAVLEDLGSKNGTKLRRQLVKGTVTLRDGDRIHLGPAIVVFHASGSGIATETIVIDGEEDLGPESEER